MKYFENIRLVSHLKSSENNTIRLTLDMARSRVDVNKSIKEKPMKKTTKKESKSRSVPSTAIAIAFTALIAICVAIYFKTGSPIQEQNLDKTPVEENRKATANNKRTEGNTDSKVLPRLDGVKVRSHNPVKYRLGDIINYINGLLYSSN